MNGNKIRVLIIEDDVVDQMAYERFIKKESLQYDLKFASSVESARREIASGSFDVVLSDFMLGDGTALDVFPEVHDTPMIVVTGTGDEETAVKAMKLGASDYLIKDPDGFFLKTLPLTVKNAIRRRNAEAELKKYRETLEKLVDERTKKLRESEERYRALITKMSNAFALQEILCDENENPCDFKYLEVNEAFEKMIGVKKEAVLGKNASEMFPDIDKSLIKKYGDVALENISIVFEHHSKKLEKYFEILAYSPRKGQFATIFTDITERKNAENEKQLLEKQLLHTQKMEALGTLAGGIAHDFNNILSIIFGYLELAQMDINHQEKLRDDLGEIGKAALRAKDLINQILTVSRKTEHEKHYIKVAIVIKEAVKLLDSTIPKSIEIEQNINTDKTVLADSTKIHQLIINLCTNAYHAMKNTGGKLTVSLDELNTVNGDTAKGISLPPGNYIRLVVSDTGHGMDDETREKIFDPYFTTKEVGEGTGLGLAVVHGVVESCNGFIYVDSRKGYGTSFYIYLPVAAADVESDTGTAPEPVRSGSERVLVVDDEKNITKITKKILTKYGYKVTIFNDSISAWEEFQKNHHSYDLVITDMTMPQMNGIELAKRIQEVKPDKPIIICSGYSELINKDRASELGLYYLPKPVSVNDMAEVIRTVFDKN